MRQTARMPALLTAALLFASPASPAAAPVGPIVTSSASFERKPRMVVLFRRFDAFFPAWCVANGKLRAGDACLASMPRTPRVRLMDGRTLQLGPLEKHVVSAWDGPERRGWAVPESDAGTAPVFVETELAVWPPDANPGLEPPPSAATPVTTFEALRALPEADEGPPQVKPSKTAPPAWPPAVLQSVPLGRHGTLRVLGGARRGLYLETPEGWRVVRSEGAAEVRSSVVGSADLDGDGRVEWIVFIKGYNEFGLEVHTADFGKALFAFNDCGV